MGPPKKKWESKFARMSGDEDLDKVQFVIYGPPGAWKTWTALGLSDKWPANVTERTRKDKPIVLDDTVHICWDPAAAVGLVPHNVQIKYSYEMADMIDSEGDVTAAMWALIDDLQKVIHHDENVKYIIHDTITSADRESLAYWTHPSRKPVTSFGKDNTQRVWGDHLAWHRSYYTYMSHIPSGITQVFLFHEKTIDMPEELRAGTAKKQLTESKNRQVGGTGINVVPAMSGNGWTFYTAGATLQACITAKPIPGKPGEFKRTLNPTSVNGRAVKNRFQTILKEPQPLDLKALLRKIQSM